MFDFKSMKSYATGFDRTEELVWQSVYSDTEFDVFGTYGSQGNANEIWDGLVRGVMSIRNEIQSEIYETSR